MVADIVLRLKIIQITMAKLTATLKNIKTSHMG